MRDNNNTYSFDFGNPGFPTEAIVNLVGMIMNSYYIKNDVLVNSNFNSAFFNDQQGDLFDMFRDDIFKFKNICDAIISDNVSASAVVKASPRIVRVVITASKD